MGIQYLGTATFLVSLTSWCHALSLIMVFGSHVIGVIGRLSLFSNLTSVVRNASSRYETDAYAHGLILASTASMAILMHIISVYFGGVSECYSAENAITVKNVTGYADIDQQIIRNSAEQFTCGASGPVAFVSFLSRMLSWLDASLAVVLFVKRQELINGAIGGSGSGEYDEIGGGEFAGDFPANGQQRVLHV